MHMCFVFGHIGNGWRGRTRFRSDTHGRTTDTPPGGPDTPPTHHRHTPDTPPDAQQVFKPVGAHHRVYTGSRSVYTVSPPTPVSTPCPRKWLVYNVSRMVVLPMCLLRVWGRRVRLQSVSWGGPPSTLCLRHVLFREWRQNCKKNIYKDLNFSAFPSAPKRCRHSRVRADTARKPVDTPWEKERQWEETHRRHTVAVDTPCRRLPVEP
jgi:hypothetical protein